MNSIFSWICRKIAQRYDSAVSYRLPAAWKKTQTPWYERIYRFLLGGAFLGEHTAGTNFRRWAKILILVGLYFFCVWFLWQTIAAWGIFS